MRLRIWKIICKGFVCKNVDSEKTGFFTQKKRKVYVIFISWEKYITYWIKQLFDLEEHLDIFSFHSEEGLAVAWALVLMETYVGELSKPGCPLVRKREEKIRSLGTHKKP
jgi:hypothetical protein